MTTSNPLVSRITDSKGNAVGGSFVSSRSSSGSSPTSSSGGGGGSTEQKVAVSAPVGSFDLNKLEGKQWSSSATTTTVITTPSEAATMLKPGKEAYYNPGSTSGSSVTSNNISATESQAPSDVSRSSIPREFWGTSSVKYGEVNFEGQQVQYKSQSAIDWSKVSSLDTKKTTPEMIVAGGGGSSVASQDYFRSQQSAGGTVSSQVVAAKPSFDRPLTVQGFAQGVSEFREMEEFNKMGAVVTKPVTEFIAAKVVPTISSPKSYNIAGHEINPQANVQNIIKDRKGFSNWLLSKEKIGYACDPVLYASAYHTHISLSKFKDKLIVVTGMEGTGKSTLASLYGSLVDDSFEVHRIATSPIEFIQWLRTSVPGQAGQIDEGALALFSRESMSDGNKKMIKTLMVIRKKSLCVLICIPDFKLIDSYIREHRCALLLHVLDRGHYKAVFGPGLKYLSQQLKYRGSIDNVKLDARYFWTGKFDDNMGWVKKEEYGVKKDEHINVFLNNLEGEYKTVEKAPFEKMIEVNQISELLNQHDETTRRMIKRGVIPAVRIGMKYFAKETEVRKLINNYVCVTKPKFEGIVGQSGT